MTEAETAGGGRTLAEVVEGGRIECCSCNVTEATNISLLPDEVDREPMGVAGVVLRGLFWL